MKKVVSLVVIVALVLLAGIVKAEDTSRGSYTTPYAPLTNLLNTNDVFHHNHAYTDTNTWRPEREAPMGVGIKTIVWESPQKYFGAFVDYRYDYENKEHSTFMMMEVNLFKLITGKAVTIE